MAKSVLDSGWGMLKAFLQYKGQQAGRTVQVVSEKDTSRSCSSCGALTGPQGVNGLGGKRWRGFQCGAWHERDVNAARNTLRRAELPASVCGNGSSTLWVPPRRASRSRAEGTEPARALA